MKRKKIISFLLACFFTVAMPLNTLLTVTAASVDMSPSAVIPDGIYYIKNKQLGVYLQVNDDDAPNYSTVSEFMELHSYDGGDYQKWRITHTSNGYYKIANVKSGYVLCVTSANAEIDGAPIIQQSYASISRKRWRIECVNGDQWKLYLKSSEGTNLCMAAGDAATGFEWITSGRNVLQRAYTDDSNYKDTWVLEPVSTDMNVVLYGIPDEVNNHDHSSALENIATDLSTLSDVSTYVMTDYSTSQNCAGTLHMANVFVSHSHGGYTNYSSGGLSRTYIYLDEDNTEILNSHYNSAAAGSCYLSGDYSNLDLALFIGCYTGQGGDGARNLPSRIVELGTTAAIGFTDEIICSEANTWVEIFFDCLQSGWSINEAITECRDHVTDTDLHTPTACGQLGLILHDLYNP